jgi:hypothetical protein
MVEQNICNVNILLTCADMRASPRAWIFCTIHLYLFVPSRIGTVKPLSACLYKTLTLMLYNLINHPNLMGARRSCGQFKDVDRDEVPICIIFLVMEGTLLDFFREREVPPEA